MGVKGLWQLLLPTGRRISIETLGGKRLAIDASIWLTQFLKANRDPETGQVRPNAHIIGFLRRICKLLFHGVRPIFVFDGATPEIKLREVRERRKRRDRLHTFKSEDDNEGVKRLARRILVATLKKQKELEKSQEKMEDGKKVKNPMEVLRNANSNAAKNTGAFASGFTLPGEEDIGVNVDNIDTAETPNAFGTNGSESAEQPHAKMPNDELILSDSEDYLKSLTREQQDTNNDWDNAIAAAESESEKSDASIEIPDDENIDIQILTSLPSKTRVEVIEKARRLRRMQSRKEFMSVAANPDSYSQCQLKNFLKSANLNKKVHQLGKIVSKTGEDVLEGEPIASDGTRRFIFEKDGDDDSIVEVNMNKRGSDLVDEITPIHQKRLRTSANKAPAEDSDSEIFEQQGKTLKCVDLFDDDSDSEGGGFVVAVEDTTQEQHKAKQHITIGTSDDSDESAAGGFIPEDNMSDGGGFMPSDSSSAQNDVGMVPASNDIVDVGSSSDEEGGNPDSGGFIPEDNMSDGGGFMPSNSLSPQNNMGNENNDGRMGCESTREDEIIEVGSSSDEDGVHSRSIPVNEDVHDAITFHGDSMERLASNKCGVKQGIDTNGKDMIEIGSSSDEDIGRAAFILSNRNNVERPATKYSVGSFTSKDNAIPAIEENEQMIGNKRSGDLDSNLTIGSNCDNLERIPDDDDGSSQNIRNENRSEIHLNSSILTKILEVGARSERNDFKDSSHENGDSSDESIAWEDGDSVEGKSLVVPQEGKYGNEIQIIERSEPIDTSNMESRNDAIIKSKQESDSSSVASSTDPASVTRSQNKSEGISSDDDVRWEDCSETIEKEEDRKRSLDSVNIEFLSNANAAALRNAQSTASHLTDWAGRAVQRAIKAHYSETVADQKYKSKEVESNESDDDDDESIVSDQSVEFVGTPMPSQKEAPSSDNSLPRIDPPALKEFIDTSLDALQREDALLRDEDNRRERDMDTVTDEMVEEVMQLLNLFGIPYLKAPAEAEAQAVELEMLGLVDGVVTEDSDAIVFGSNSVYRHIFDDKKYVELYSSSDSESIGLGLNEKIALAMLLGGDYTEGVKGVGIVNGMEILKAFPVSPSIETGLQKFRQWLDGFDLDDGDDDENPNIVEFRRKHKSARTRWICPKDFPSPAVLRAYSNPVVDSSKESFSWTEIPDLDALRLFCLQKMGWESAETDRAIVPVINEMKKGVRQTRLDSYFMRSEDNIKFADIRSKRLQQVWKTGIKKNDAEES